MYQVFFSTYIVSIKTMIIRFFKSDQSISIILLPLFALLFWIFGFVHPQVLDTAGSMPLYNLLIGGIINYKFFSIGIAVLLVIIESFTINHIINNHEILGKQSYMPALFYILLMSSSPFHLALHPGLFANLFLMLAMNQLFNIYRKEISFSQVFDAGLLIALASLFYLPSILLFPLVWIALIVFRPFIWREWIIALIGLIVPYLYLCVYYFWQGSLDHIKEHLGFMVKAEGLNIVKMSGYSYFFIAIIILLVILSLGNLFAGLTVNNKLKAKNSLILWSWFLLFSLFMFPIYSIKYISFIAIPLSVFYANYFLQVKKEWWAEFLFLILIISIVLNQLF